MGVINKLLPILYNNNIEMQELMNTEQIEFDGITFTIRSNFENTFIKIADSDGLLRFEKMMGIVANPETEDLDFRRERLWNRINSSPLYTERYLEQKLNDILKPDNYYYEINYNNYTLDIYATRPGKLWLNELKKLLEKIMPCNIVWTIHLYAATWQAVYDNTSNWNDLYNENLTWQEVMEGEWIDE